VTAQADVWDQTTGPNGTMVQVDGGQPPMQTDTTFDGAGRQIKQTTKTGSTVRWTIDTAYTGDTTSTTAPVGGQATTITTNALGQTTQRREYGGPQVGTNFTTTDFTYTPAGLQDTITGPDGKKWSYSYDLYGRQGSATDPDKGTTATKYNELDQVISTTDGQPKTLLTEYDVLGRKTGMWQTSKTDANKLASWEFDTLRKGQQDTATRYDGGVSGKAYTSKVTAYNAMYQITANQLILPGTDPLVAAGVPATLAFTTAYRLDGTISQHREPAVAGLATETVANTYNPTGQQLTSKGTTGYLQGAVYSPQGDLRQLTLATDPTAGKNTYLNYDYEVGTRRLTHSFVTDDIHAYRAQDLTFTQDDAGNISSIFDASTLGGASKADNQCFTYDGHRRLTEAWTPRTADCTTTGRTTTNLDGAAPYWTSYSYNDAGQRKTETTNATSGNSATIYEYGTPAGQPHPLTKTTGAKAATYTYDSAGNTISRPGTQATQTLNWNAEGNLASACGRHQSRLGHQLRIRRRR